MIFLHGIKAWLLLSDVLSVSFHETIESIETYSPNNQLFPFMKVLKQIHQTITSLFPFMKVLKQIHQTIN